MREATVPRGVQSPLVRSAVASLATILEIDGSEIPLPPDGHPAPWTLWGGWLAGRGLGLVPIADPREFRWPGPWLALLSAREARGDGSVAAVAFGAPPGLAWHPLGGPETFDDVATGYAVAPLDVALWRPVPRQVTRRVGVVERLAIAPDRSGPMVFVDEAFARASRGLEGDRYHSGRGTFSNPHARGHDLTLIEAEVLEALRLPDVQAARRNVITRGIDLNGLVGRRFTIGDVECEGVRLCEPCAHLQRLTHPGVLRALVHRGGLRADVVGDGAIRVGDSIRPLE